MIPVAYFDDQPATLWTLVKDNLEMACLARLQPYGIEVDITRDGALVVTRTFESGDEALSWSAQRKSERISQGWQSVDA